MLTDKEIFTLGHCHLDNHIILEIDGYTPSKEGEAIRNRFNNGESLTSEEASLLPHCESLEVKKITNINDIRFLTSYGIEHGRDLQSLFEISDFKYLTLFIDNENINSDFKNLLVRYDLLNLFESNEMTSITISFPEKTENK